MNVFEAVKQAVTARQAAELYGIRVGRNGMAVCPFHVDRNTTFLIGLHYSKDSNDTFEDKAKKLICKEVKDGDFNVLAGRRESRRIHKIAN